MPVVVHRHAVVAAPGWTRGVHPGDAVGRAALHLAHMRHCVHRPGIVGVQLHRAAAKAFGALEGEVFFQPEGHHAEHVAIAGVLFAPVAAHPGDAVAQHCRAAQHQVAHMRQLQCQQVARVLDEVAVQTAQPRVHVAAGPDAQRGKQRLLARRRRVPAGRGELQAFGCRGEQRQLEGAEHQPGLQQVAGDEVRVVGEHRCQQRQRVHAPAVEQVQSRVVGFCRRRERGGQCLAV